MLFILFLLVALLLLVALAFNFKNIFSKWNKITVRCIKTPSNIFLLQHCPNLLHITNISTSIPSFIPKPPIDNTNSIIETTSVKLHDTIKDYYFDEMEETKQSQQLEIQSKKNTHFLLTYPIIQILFSEWYRQHKTISNLLPYDREKIVTPDGGYFTLEWYPQKPSGNSIPIILLTHGVGGSHRSHYIQHLIRHIHTVWKGKCITVVMTRRGCGDLTISSQFLNNDVTDLSDFRLGIQHLELNYLKKYSINGIYSIGFSFGAIQTSHYIAECAQHNRSHPFRSVVLLSIPFCIYEMDQLAMKQSFLPSYLGTRFLKKQFLKKENVEHLKRNPSFNLEKALSVRNSEEWNQHVTMHVHQQEHESMERYYMKASAKKWIHKMKNCHALIVASLDDPLMPPELYDSLSLYNRNPELIYVQCQYGSHGTLLDQFVGHWPSWVERIATEFLMASEALRIKEI